MSTGVVLPQTEVAAVPLTLPPPKDRPLSICTTPSLGSTPSFFTDSAILLASEDISDSEWHEPQTRLRRYRHDVSSLMRCLHRIGEEGKRIIRTGEHYLGPRPGFEVRRRDGKPPTKNVRYWMTLRQNLYDGFKHLHKRQKSGQGEDNGVAGEKGPVHPSQLKAMAENKVWAWIESVSDGAPWITDSPTRGMSTGGEARETITIPSSSDNGKPALVDAKPRGLRNLRSAKRSLLSRSRASNPSVDTARAAEARMLSPPPRVPSPSRDAHGCEGRPSKRKRREEDEMSDEVADDGMILVRRSYRIAQKRPARYFNMQ